MFRPESERNENQLQQQQQQHWTTVQPKHTHKFYFREKKTDLILIFNGTGFLK